MEPEFGQDDLKNLDDFIGLGGPVKYLSSETLSPYQRKFLNGYPESLSFLNRYEITNITSNI